MAFGARGAMKIRQDARRALSPSRTRYCYGIDVLFYRRLCDLDSAVIRESALRATFGDPRERQPHRVDGGADGR